MKLSIDARNKTRFTNQSTSMYIGDRFIPVYGSVSASFGVAGTNYVVFEQSDGKVLIGGNSFFYYKDVYARNLIRILPNGEPDPDFNTGQGFNNTIYSINQQSDGKILISGNFTTYSGSTVNYFVRLNSSGAIDPDFKTGAGFNLAPYDLYIQSDNKILIGGSFTTYSGSSVNNLIRVNPSGTIDTTFNITTPPTSVRAIIQQQDSKILVGGNFITPLQYITRYDVSGSLDPDFNQTGSSFNSFIETIIQQQDGKILVAGAFTSYSGSTTNRIVRLNLSGTIDPDFKTGAGFNGLPFSIDQQSDGKILLGGQFTQYSGSTSRYIARLNTSGSLDTDFKIGSSGFNDRTVSVIQKSDKTILAAGDFTTYSGSTAGKYDGIIQLSDSGSIYDTNQTVYPNIGVATGSFARPGNVYTVATQSDGKILLGGEFSFYKDKLCNGIIRLNSNYEPDPDFNIGSGFNQIVNTIYQQSDGKILVGGDFTSYSGSTANYIVRLNPSGTIDTDFNTGVGLNASAYSITQQSDDKILVGFAGTTYSGSTVNRLIRLNPSGTIDPDFNTGTNLDSLVFSVYQQLDGKILVGGIFTSASGVPSPRIARFDISGSLDPDFNQTGSGFNNWVYSIIQQSDDKILVGGLFTSYSGSTRNRIVRLNPSGTIDPDFNIGSGFSGGSNNVRIILQQSDGKILVGGSFTSYASSTTVNNIVRINSSGSIDSTFKIGDGFSNYTVGSTTIYASTLRSIKVLPNNKILTGGSGVTTYSGSAQGKYDGIIELEDSGSISSANFYGGVRFFDNSVVTDMIKQQDGKLVFVGNLLHRLQNPLYYTSSFTNVVRLNTDYTLDTTFKSGVGFNTTAVSVVNSTIIFGLRVLEQKDGKLIFLACGTFYSGSSSIPNRIVRTTSSGSIDPDFNGGTGFSNVVKSGYIQSDGKILAVGNFGSYSGSSSSGVVRILPSGSKDPDFNIGSGIGNGSIDAVIQQIDGKILLGGSFSFFSGSTDTSINLIRVTNSGSVDLDFTETGSTDSDVLSLYQQSDGKILVGGRFTFSSGSVNRITRINLTGSRDLSFNVGTGANDTVLSVYQQPDGKILVGGAFTTYSGSTVSNVVRLNPSGTIDSNFSASGFNSVGFGVTNLVTNVFESNNIVNIAGTIPLYSGSRVGGYVGLPISSSATSGSPAIITKSVVVPSINFYGGVRTNATVYSAIEESDVIPPVYGLATGSFAYPAVIENIITQSDGKILIGGSIQLYKDRFFNGIARLNSNYEPDPDFNPGIGFNNRVRTMYQQSDGKILVGGDFTEYSGSSRSYMVRINPNGTIDSDFGQGAFNSTVRSIVQQSDGKILVGFAGTTYSGSTVNRLVRLNPSGSIDTDFNIGTGLDGSVVSVLQQPDGKILLTGAFTTASGQPAQYITRYNISGGLDPDFNQTGSGFNLFTQILYLQSDGKILVGGAFTSYSGSTANRLARLNPSGSIDPDFSPGGSGFNNLVISITQQSDGKILVGGIFIGFNGGTDRSLIRLNISGSKDTTFNTGTGFLVDQLTNVSTNVTSIVQLQNGKILVGGSFQVYSGSSAGKYDGIIELENSASISNANFYGGVRTITDVSTNQIITQGGIRQTDGKYIFGGNFFRLQKPNYYTSSYGGIIRLNSRLDPDPDFNPGAGFTNINNISSLKFYEQTDRKLIIYGGFTNYSGSSRNRIVRINPSGSIDTDFNIGSGFNNDVYAVYEQSDGKLLIGGAASTYSGSTINYIVRLNPSGTIDTDFNTGNGADSTITTIYKQSDNKILLGGFFTTYSGSAVGRGIVRVYDSGTIDPDFNQTGSGFSSAVYAITQQSDGKLLIGGDSNLYSGSTQRKLVRLNLSGSLDTSFNIGTGFSDAGSVIYSIVQQPDNKILAGGSFTTYSGSKANSITRLNISGSIDTTFNTGSYVSITNQNLIYRYVRNISLNSDNTIDLFGPIAYYSGSIRSGYIELNPSGSIANIELSGSRLIPNGKVILGGDFTRLQKSPYTASYGRIIRLLNNGNVDSDFKTGTGFSSTVFSITQQSDGKILLGGFFTTYSGSSGINYITRLTLSGSKDPDISSFGVNSIVYSVIQQTDGKILVAGAFTTASGQPAQYITRYNISGGLDPDFQTGSGFNNPVNSIIQQLDGKILAGGTFVTYSGVPSRYIARLTPSGTLDTDFNIGTGFSSVVESIYQQSDGKILAGGQFNSYSGSSRNRIVRINPNGTIDPDFSIGTGFNSAVYSVYQQSDGKILVGGAFDNYQSTSSYYVARLNSSGSFDRTLYTDASSPIAIQRSVQQITQQSNGNILVVGSIQSYSGSNYLGGFVGLTSSGSIARYTSPSSYIDPLSLK